MKTEAELFKALGDSTRLQLVGLLSRCGEMCVCELTQALGAPQPRVSRHLGVLRAAGLVAARRVGTWMHYRLAEAETPLAQALKDCIHTCLRQHPAVEAAAAQTTRACCSR